MEITHNDLIEILVDINSMPLGIYRVIAVFPKNNLIFLYNINSTDSAQYKFTGSVKNLYLSEYQMIIDAIRDNFVEMIEQSVNQKVILRTKTESDSKVEMKRMNAMSVFFDLTLVNNFLLKYSSLQPLVMEVVKKQNISQQSVLNYIAMLAYYGWRKESLDSEFHKCGAPGFRRFVNDPNKRVGRRSKYEKILSRGGEEIILQSGVTKEIFTKIENAYEVLFRDKRWPSEQDMYDDIKMLAFDNDEDYKNSTSEFKHYQIPNKGQVLRICKSIDPRYQQNVHTKSQKQFKLTGRSLLSSIQSISSGPGDVYAVDATIGDAYLVSSWNRTKYYKRPTVYFVVDVYSTAIVAYHIGFEKPSKSMIDLLLFSIGCPLSIMNKIRCFEGRKSFNVDILKQCSLLSDNGEAKQKKMRDLAFDKDFDQYFAPPYRADLKGNVEGSFHLLSSGLERYLGTFTKKTDNFERAKIKKNATYTIHEYRELVDNWVYMYNSSSERIHLLSPELIALNCTGTPASIYDCAQHLSVNGGRYDLDSAIKTYLPKMRAYQTKYGLMVNKLYYTNHSDEDRFNAVLARNKGTSKIEIAYHPDAVDSIWMPDENGTTYIELKLSDRSSKHRNSSWFEYYEFLDQVAEIEEKQTHRSTGERIATKLIMRNISQRSINAKKQAKKNIEFQDIITNVDVENIHESESIEGDAELDSYYGGNSGYQSNSEDNEWLLNRLSKV